MSFVDDWMAMLRLLVVAVYCGYGSVWCELLDFAFVVCLVACVFVLLLCLLFAFLLMVCGYFLCVGFDGGVL